MAAGLGGSDVPRPFFNALVDGEARTHEVDAHWDSQRLAAQVDGFEFHRTRTLWRLRLALRVP